MQSLRYLIGYELKVKRTLLGMGFGSPKVTQSLGFRSKPSDSKPSLEIASRFEFISRDVCTLLRIDYHGFESNGPDLKSKD